MTTKYTYQWTCSDCEMSNSIARTKFQAAFEHSPKLPPCTKCGGLKYYSSSFDLAEIDIELLEAWYADPKLSFLSQDEDLIVAETDIEILRTFLDARDDIKGRGRALGPILAVKLYDDRFESPAQREWCVEWLSQNKDLWLDFTQKYIIKKTKPLLK